MLGERLVKLRKSRKLTQQQIADKLCLSRGTYAQYEIERRVPEFGTLEKLANFFEVSIDYLVGRTNHTTDKPMELTSEEEKLKTNFLSRMSEILEEKSGLDPAKMEMVLKLMESGFMDDLAKEKKGKKSRTKIED